MKKTRIIVRPWARRRRGGWIFNPDSLLDALKQGDAVQIGEVKVGTKNLRAIIRGYELPDNQVLLVKNNGNLEIENIQLRYVKDPKGPYPRKGVYRTNTPRLRHIISLNNGAWLKKGVEPTMTVVLRPKKY